MIPPVTIFSTWYGKRYGRLARVWRTSLEHTTPEARIVEVESRPPDFLINRIGHGPASNTHKLGLWRDAAIEFIEQGHRVVLMDADTFAVRDVTAAFDTFSGDVALTEREHRCRVNGGVVFLNPTRGAAQFMRDWCATNAKYATDRRSAQRAFSEAGGLNQAAAARMLGTGMDARAAFLPCHIWNCEQTSWRHFDPDRTAVVHVKDALRARVLRGDRGDENGGVKDRLVAMYRRWERIAGGVHAGA